VLLHDNHPVAFWSRTMNDAENKYHTTEKELLGVVAALEEWRCYLLDKPFRVFTDHNPNIFFDTKPQLSPRHVRWAQRLSKFNFSWEFKPGRLNVADPLSRVKWGASLNALFDATEPHSAAKFSLFLSALITRQVSRSATLAAVLTRSSKRVPDEQAHVFCNKPEVGKKPRVTKSETTGDSTATVLPGPPPIVQYEGPVEVQLSALERQILKGYSSDPLFADKTYVAQFTYKHGLYFKADRICVPDVPIILHQILHEAHDVPYRGHLGVNKTVKEVERRYFWPKMQDMINEYVVTCPSCQR
jgi:hypothetical protein